jgi:hypothetical protein
MTTFNEIYAFNDDTIELFGNLTVNEKLFTYYMFRASLPFNKIYRDQNHVHTNEIIKAFEFLYKNENNLPQNLSNDIKTYLVYLWSNNGPYFMTEQSNNKRTPSRLNMKYLTKEVFTHVLTELNYGEQFEHLLPTIFDDNVDAEMVVDSSIEQSGNNYYSKNFTEEHYNSLLPEQKNKINAYFEIDKFGKPLVSSYAINSKYSNELNITVFWLEKALVHAKSCPDIFDEHIVNSITLLIKYFESGDEEIFKQHSIEWLQTNSNLDYTMGFIETYHDPKSIRGQAGAEITVKMENMEKLNPLLLEIEQRMPIPDEYKKKNDKKTIMNVSPNRILFASGDFGPLVSTAAYCLPNYDDIRSNVGSKQILYKMPKSVGEILNPEMAKLFRTKRRVKFIEKYDPNNELGSDLWDVQVLLHETVGHGSGALHEHKFKEGENLVISGVTYNVGDVIPITDANYAEFITEDSSSLEELRAEINALYMSIAEMSQLSNFGLFKNWREVLGLVKLEKECVLAMASTGFRRLLAQSENMTEIKGAHARANIVIMNYLIAGGGLSINTEVKNIDGEDYTLMELVNDSMGKCWDSIIQLLQMVQKIKSTGDTNGCKSLFETYTKYPITIDEAKVYRQHMVKNRTKLIGDIKATVKIFPQFIPIFNDGEISDVGTKVSDDIFQQNLYLENLTLSYEY